jgi:hypothetical protein
MPSTTTELLMPTLTGHTRHHRPSGRDELTAVAPINLRSEKDQKYLNEILAESRRKSRKLWKHYEGLGEVHYSIRRTARIAGYSKFAAIRRNPDGSAGEPHPTAKAIVDGIYSRYGGVRGLIEGYYTLLKIPADMVLIRTKDEAGDYDGYHFLSADSIERDDGVGAGIRKPGIRWQTLPMTTAIPENRAVVDIPAKDVLGRIWQPSARYPDIPDSPLSALDNECETLKTLTLTVKAKLKSRFATAGLLFLPNTLRDARVSGLNPQSGLQKSVLDTLIEGFTRGVINWEDSSTWVPMLVMGDPDAGEKIKHIVLDREVFETDIKLRAELIERILFGLDVIGSAAKGGEDQSHWGAWEASDQERRIAVAPDLDTLVWALERVVLHKQMKDEKIPDEEILLHELTWDMSGAAVRTNQQEDTRQAFDRGAAGDKSIRRTAGLGDEDKPTESEDIVFAGVKTNNPYLIAMGKQGKLWADVDWEEVAKFGGKTGPGAETGGDKAKAGPGVGNPGAPGGGDRDGPKRSRPAD